MDDGFAQAPMSLAEARAHREENAALWSPRDALISLLRDIDAGKVDPYAMVIAYGQREAGGRVSTSSLVAGGDRHTQVGIVSLVQARMAGGE